jgi:hypothetical protein
MNRLEKQLLTHEQFKAASREEDQEILQRQARELARDEAQVRANERNRIDPLEMQYATEQRRGLLRLSPRRRSRQLAELDARVEDLEVRLGAAIEDARQLEQDLADAIERDRQRLSDWHAGGANGSRPKAEARDVEQRLAEQRADVAALEPLLDAALSEKETFVAKHRKALVKGAHAHVHECQIAYERLLDGLSRTRDELIDARRDELQLALHGHEASRETYGFPNALGAGLVRVTRPLGTTARIEFVQLLEALRIDAETLAALASPAQRRALGADDDRTPADEAMWADDPRAQRYHRSKSNAYVTRERGVRRNISSASPKRYRGEAAPPRAAPPSRRCARRGWLHVSRCRPRMLRPRRVLRIHGRLASPVLPPPLAQTATPPLRHRGSPPRPEVSRSPVRGVSATQAAGADVTDATTDFFSTRPMTPCSPQDFSPRVEKSRRCGPGVPH